MRELKKILWILVFVLLGVRCSIAQEQMKMEPVPYTMVKVQVISLFEKTNDVALLKVLQAKDTSFPAATGAEIVTRFAFSTNARPNFDLPGVQKGNILHAQIAVKKSNGSNNQHQYKVLRYRVISPKKSAESP